MNWYSHCISWLMFFSGFILTFLLFHLILYLFLGDIEEKISSLSMKEKKKKK